jgi:hypothetical protein
LFDAFPPLDPITAKERVLAGDYRV